MRGSQEFTKYSELIGVFKTGLVAVVPAVPVAPLLSTSIKRRHVPLTHQPINLSTTPGTRRSLATFMVRSLPTLLSPQATVATVATSGSSLKGVEESVFVLERVAETLLIWF